MSIVESMIVKFWEGVRKKDLKRLSGQTPPENVTEFTDIDYAGAGDRMRFADVYCKAGCENTPLPVIFDIHGGGWYYGDKELNKIYALNLAADGRFKVVNLSYRLTPEATLGQQLKDVAEAVDYFVGRAREYAFDRENIFVTGDSAGGNLAGMLAKAPFNPRLREYYAIDPPTFNAVGFTSAAFCLSGYNRPLIKSYFAPLFRDGVPEKEFIDYTAGLPGNSAPAFIITGRGDFLRKESRKVFGELRTLGVDSVLHDDDGEGRNIGHVFPVTYPNSPCGRRANRAMLDFFASHMRN